MTPVRLEPTALRSRVKHSTTEPLRSLRGIGGLTRHIKGLSGIGGLTRHIKGLSGYATGRYGILLPLVSKLVVLDLY